MSDVPPLQDPFVSPQAVEKKGMSSGARLLLILAILFLLCVLVCCGGIGILMYQASAYMKDAFTEDPAIIDQRRAELLDIDVPEGFAPKVSIDMKVPMTDSRLMTIVVYENGPRNSLVLVGVGDMLSEMSKEDMEREIENSLQQQGLGQPTPGAKWESETREYQIGGKPVSFKYQTVKNENDEVTNTQVTGLVDGKRGPVLVTLSADAETLNEEQIDQVIKSIK